MQNQIVLSPEELYYLGSVLQAKYIDYAYIAAMNDIKQNFPLFEQETKTSLISAGILMEDFGGNVEVDGVALKLVKPIFFGESETSVDVCHLGESNVVHIYKFHFYDGVATMVTGEEGKLILKSVDQMAIREFANSLLPQGYRAEKETVPNVDKEGITRFLAVKSIEVGKMAVVKTYIEAGGILYQETQAGIESVTGEEFLSDVYGIIKGV